MRTRKLLLAVWIVLAGCGEPSVATSSSPTATPAQALSSEPTPSASPTPTDAAPASASASSAPSATGMHAPGDLVAVVTTDLVVRSLPGTGDDSVIYPARLSAPSTAYVIDGPAFADGYEWYLLDPVRLDYVIYGGPPGGWVAAAGTDGELWLGSHAQECLDRPTFEQFVRLPPQIRLYCHAGQELEFEAFFDPSRESLILPHANSLPWEFAVRAVAESDRATPPPDCVDCGTPSLFVAYDVEVVGGVIYLPGAGRMTGHVGDEAATECRPPDPTIARALAVHACHMVFVATAF